jgi:ribosomal protein S24E
MKPQEFRTSASDTPALRKTEFQMELRHRLRADPSNEVRREALALLTNAQLRETVQHQLDQVLAKRRL